MPKGPRLHPQTPPDPATGKGCVLPNSPSRPQHPPGFHSDELSSSGSFAPEQIHSPTRCWASRTAPSLAATAPSASSFSKSQPQAPGDHVPRSANGAGA